VASNDVVTARFMAFMDLAEWKKLVDIGHLVGGSTKQTSQVYLLGRVFTHKEVDIWAL
jgi:hypothetical protein